jgi:hypothetical protein
MPQIPGDYTATMHYKRYLTQDEITSVDFALKDGAFSAQLPVQPSAGKMDYYITGSVNGESFRIPEEGEDNIVLRYKDPVPDYILIPHVCMMILVIIFGIRSGLSALMDPNTMRKWVVVALSAMTLVE